jgi:hypothetical protein
MNSKTTIHDVTVALGNTQINGDSDMTIKIPYQYNSIIPKGMDVHVSNWTLIRIVLTMKGFTKLSRLVMRMSFQVLNLKIWSYYKDHKKLCN